jgi:vancomycin resistance protein VanJ
MQFVRFSTRLAGRLSLAGAQLLIVAIFAWLVFRFYPGDRWTPVRLGNYFAPWLFMALLPALGITLLGRRRRWARLMALLLLVFMTRYWPLVLPRSPQAYAQAGADSLRVMTFNVNFSNRNAPGIAELIALEQPDIIAFQEMTEDLSAALWPKIEADYPYYLVDDSWDLQMAIASRYPLATLPKHPNAIRAQHGLVKTPAGEVALWNIHPNPAITGGWESQRRLLALVAEDIAGEDRPVIVLGDFNATDQSENYQLIANHLTDAQWAAGQGFSFTFPDLSRAITPEQPWYIRALLNMRPLVRIDHIFVSQHFTPRSTRVLPEAYGSDHRPVAAELNLSFH